MNTMNTAEHVTKDEIASMLTKFVTQLHREIKTLHKRLNRMTHHGSHNDSNPPLNTGMANPDRNTYDTPTIDIPLPKATPPMNYLNPNDEYWECQCLAAESQLYQHRIPLPLTPPKPSTSITPPQPWTGQPAAQTLFSGTTMTRAKLTPKTRNVTKKPQSHPQEIIVPCSDPRALTDNMNVQVGMAVNVALCRANAPTNVASATVRKNISGNLMLTPSPYTSAQELLPHLDLIHEATHAVNPALLPPCLNEKWYKLAIHGIPTDHYPDTTDGMRDL
jgi:hypothetical protein